MSSLEWINNGDRQAAVTTASKEETIMQSNNPVFRNSEGFNGQATQNAYGNQTYPGSGQSYPGYGSGPASDPSTWGTGVPTDTTRFDPTRRARMTIDSTVQKSAITIGVVVVMAAVTWLFTGDIKNEETAGTLYLAMMIGMGGAFALSLVNSFKRVVSPAACHRLRRPRGSGARGSEQVLRRHVRQRRRVRCRHRHVRRIRRHAGGVQVLQHPGQQPLPQVRRRGHVRHGGLSLLELVLGMFGSSFGLFGFGALGLLIAVAGLVLGVFMLIMDFDFIEQGIAAGLDERESWRAAFGLTVSLVWIYTNLLRLLAIFSDN